VQQDVFRLDVPVDHPLGMGVPQCGCHVEGDTHRLLNRQGALANQTAPERLSRHVRHDVVEKLLFLAGVDQGEDMGVVEPCGYLHFALETLRADPGGNLRMEDLDRDGAAMLEVVRQVDCRHSSAPDLPLEVIAAAQRGMHTIHYIRHGEGSGGGNR
jgi:hypothetical protein